LHAAIDRARYILSDENAKMFFTRYKIFLTHVPQDSEASLETLFKSKSRPAWNFTLQKRQYSCMEK